MLWPGEHDERQVHVVVFKRSRSQPTQAQLMRDKFHETLCIEQGLVLSCMHLCPVEGSMGMACALDGSRHAVNWRRVSSRVSDQVTDH